MHPVLFHNMLVHAQHVYAHPPKPKPTPKPKGLPQTPPVPGANTQGQDTQAGYDAHGNPLPALTTTQVMDNGMTVPQGQQLSPMLAVQMAPMGGDPAYANFDGPLQEAPVVANFQTDRHDITLSPAAPRRPFAPGLTIPPR